jgi:hypothetical protein
MKTRFLTLAILLVASARFLYPSSLLAQGPLTPPGPPGMTYKTLQQVEPRVEINATNTPGDADSLFQITQPGSYYLTSNLTGVVAKYGIEIAASGVTLDLMGFELAGVSNSLNGIEFVGAQTNVTIRNGAVRNWGDNGVRAPLAVNSRFERLLVSGNVDLGLWLGDSCVVSDCTVSGNGSGIQTGHRCLVRDSTVTGPPGAGISTGTDSLVVRCVVARSEYEGILVGDRSTVTDCTVYQNAGEGIKAFESCVISGCTVRANALGISAGSECTIRGCTVTTNQDDGIRVSADCLVAENHCYGNSNGGIAAGIRATGRENVIDSNNLAANDLGLRVTGLENLIIRNTASGNSTNYVIAATNKVGVIVAAPNSAAISGSTGGAGVGTTNAWANLSY